MNRWLERLGWMLGGVVVCFVISLTVEMRRSEEKRKNPIVGSDFPVVWLERLGFNPDELNAWRNAEQFHNEMNFVRQQHAFRIWLSKSKIELSEPKLELITQPENPEKSAPLAQQ